MPDRLRGCLPSVCDTLILHPNVVNASDINEMPENSLYVEGSVICRLLMGTAGLLRVRSNRVLVVIDRHEEIAYSNAAINAVNAARACYGFDCPRIVMLDPPVKLVSEYTSTGRAAGRVDNLSRVPRRNSPFSARKPTPSPCRRSSPFRLNSIRITSRATATW